MKRGLFVRLAFMGLAFVVAFAALSGQTGCGDDSGGASDGGLDGTTGDGGVEPVLSWDEPDYPYRRLLVVNPHPERDRADMPVLTTLSAAGSFVARDVRVYDLGVDGHGEPSLVESGAWSQPDGTVLEVGFTASGVIPAGKTRSFLIYYHTKDTPDAWTETTPDWAHKTNVDSDDNGTVDGYRLASDKVAIGRAVRESDGSLVRGRDTSGQTELSLPPESWTVVDGFLNAFQLETSSQTFDVENVESGAVTAVHADGDTDGLSAALGFTWEGRTDPMAHDVFLTYRLFRDWPLAEQVLSVSVQEQDASDTVFSSDSYSGRTLYLPDSYDRMQSDTRGDEAFDKVWDTSMRWLVAYDSNTNRGVGWFLTAPGVVRAGHSDGKPILYDSYGYSAGHSTQYRYLWMASSNADDIVSLFDAMVPGVTLGATERRDINIVAPKEEDFFFPEDQLVVVVTTPGQNAAVTATVTLTDQTEIPIEMVRTDDPLRWQSKDPLPLTADQPPGHWTVTADAGDADAQVGFEFRIPNHPHLFFGAEDLVSLRARVTNPAYAAIWEDMLHQASGYDDPIPDPGPGKDIRSYADRLMNLALIQLMDPSQPYDEKLWTYFFTMLRYPNWDEGGVPFNNLDLTVGHFLTALAVTYDWHYDHLTPDERKEVRNRLDTVAGDWVNTSHMRVYRDIDWHHYGSVTNNHYWINNEGVAAAAYVLADEIPESRRRAWVDRTEENLANILTVLEPDGTSNEGVAYHSYGQINLFRWLDMRDRALGGNTAQENAWFDRSVLWDLYSILPGGDDNYGGVANFGDCPTRHYQPPRTIQAWLAARLGDGVAQWTAENLDWPRLTAMSFLWYDSSVTAVAPSSLPTWRMFDFKGIFAWRSSWDAAATYFSLKSGAYYGGHEQPDAGHFILHRAGVPYVTDLGYSYFKTADEHNVVLIDDVGQYGGQRQWMASVDPAHWAHAEAVIADTSYFDLLADPTHMVKSDALSSWIREVVCIAPDLFFVRDTVDATAQVTMGWLLHSYRSDPPTSETRTYSYKQRRTENPFATVDGRHYTITPQDSASSLHVADVSYQDWNDTVEESRFVPEQKPDGGYNENKDSFQFGYRLHRTVVGDSGRSLVLLSFGENLTVTSWSTAQADAAQVADGSGGTVVALWPNASGTTLSNFHGYDLNGDMAGRVQGTPVPALFGRGITRFAQSGQVLVQADGPVDVFSRLEHSPTSDNPTFALVRATASTTVTLRCTVSPSTVLLDGNTVTYTWNASELTVTVGPGSHRIDVQ